MVLKVASILLLISVVCGRPEYRNLIPNGPSVPNPCGSTVIWDAVGHFQPLKHTHLKNSFGNDLRNNAYDWSRICHMDSDNDGRTNGDELGDPNCVWTTGTTPTGQASGHPGLCEPIGSARCAWQNFGCDCLDHCSGLVGFP